jgi:2-hydroxymuconate-semialdehyde hydrolase
MPSTAVRSLFADVGGIRTHYLEAGDGPVVVLLHSGEFGASAELCWEHNIDALAAEHRVIAPDWLGYGDTDKIKDFVSGSDRMIRHMAAFLREIHIESADFVGCSMGGTMLLREASSGSCRLPVDRMALLSAGGEIPDNEARRTVLSYDGTTEGMRAILRACFADSRWVDDDDYVKRRVEASLAPGAWEVIAATRLKAPNIEPRQQFGHADTTNYEAVAHPTLVIAGGADRLRHPGYEQVMRRIPGAQIHVVPGAGHLLNIERSEECNELLHHFLAPREDERA